MSSPKLSMLSSTDLRPMVSDARHHPHILPGIDLLGLALLFDRPFQRKIFRPRIAAVAFVPSPSLQQHEIALLRQSPFVPQTTGAPPVVLDEGGHDACNRVKVDIVGLF